jgi:D-alanyl-D-alanine carboxypeptidase
MDLSVLARHLAYDFPQYFPYFALPGFNYKGVYYPTHDNLIGRYPGADGIKTGFIVASGFNLTSSVVRNGVHLIGIVMGGRTAVRRDLEMMHLMDTAFAQIDANPALVARGPTPWTAMADAGQPPAIAGFALPAQTNTPAKQFAALSAVPPPIPDSDDEDAAEARRAPDENFSVIHAEAPQLASVAQAPKPAPAAAIRPTIAEAASAPIPATHPSARPANANIASASPIPATKPQARPVQANDTSVRRTQMAATTPAQQGKPVVVAMVPKMRPGLHADAGEGDQDQAGVAIPGRNWTIQIGAYADQAFAKAQLDAYAQKSLDVLGQAARLVVPFQSSDGHTMYRARFGLFAERQAREVCDRLTQRGQTCFAAVAAR